MQLPYFDYLIERLEIGDRTVEKIFGRHVHWGYWENPENATKTPEDFAIASEALCQKVCNAGQVQNSYKILDAGCGFGGTIATLNEQYHDLQLTGLNIDPRQLARAKKNISPQNNNQIDWVEGDACKLPFPDNTFDVVFAVECIFHFPSRQTFFQEAQRVLKPQGRLAICDFVPLSILVPFIKGFAGLLESSFAQSYGSVNSKFTLNNYQQLARKTGFQLDLIEDITRNTLPTYPVVIKLFEDMGVDPAKSATVSIDLLSRWQLLRYLILSFKR